MNTTTGITLGGLTAAAIVLLYNLRPWWTGNRDAKQLAAFGKGTALGLVSAVCPGGILGWLHAHSGGAANSAGGRITSGATGVHAAAPVAHRSLTGLDEPGACVVAVLAIVVVIAWKAAGKRDKWRMAGGTFVASVLCLTAGVIGALTWMPGLLNGVGASVAHAVGKSL